MYSCSVLKDCFFSFASSSAISFFRDGDAHFRCLALDPDRVEDFPERFFLQFLIFFVARFGNRFDFPLGRGLKQGALELGFGDRAEAVRSVFDDRDIARGHAGIADPLGNREDDEEENEEGTEGEQRKSLQPG